MIVGGSWLIQTFAPLGKNLGSMSAVLGQAPAHHRRAARRRIRRTVVVQERGSGREVPGVPPDETVAGARRQERSAPGRHAGREGYQPGRRCSAELVAHGKFKQYPMFDNFTASSVTDALDKELGPGSSDRSPRPPRSPTWTRHAVLPRIRRTLTTGSVADVDLRPSSVGRVARAAARPTYILRRTPLSSLKGQSVPPTCAPASRRAGRHRASADRSGGAGARAACSRSRSWRWCWCASPCRWGRPSTTASPWDGLSSKFLGLANYNDSIWSNPNICQIVTNNVVDPALIPFGSPCRSRSPTCSSAAFSVAGPSARSLSAHRVLMGGDSVSRRGCSATAEGSTPFWTSSGWLPGA